MCPYHKRLEYGKRQDSYDTIRIFFDCGTMLDIGYGEFIPPKQYKTVHISYDAEGKQWEAYTRRPCFMVLGKAKTRAGIGRKANYHLKPGGTVVWPEGLRV